MLSKKTKYGLQAMLHLAKKYGHGSVLIADLASEEGISKKFLETILLNLKNKGLLQSKRGKGGGYSLNRSPKEITMGEIVRILEGPLAPVSCVSHSAYRKCEECQDESVCGIKIVMKEVRDAMVNILDHTTLSDVIQRISTITERGVLSYSI